MKGKRKILTALILGAAMLMPSLSFAGDHLINEAPFTVQADPNYYYGAAKGQISNIMGAKKTTAHSWFASIRGWYNTFYSLHCLDGNINRNFASYGEINIGGGGDDALWALIAGTMYQDLRWNGKNANAQDDGYIEYDTKNLSKDSNDWVFESWLANKSGRSFLNYAPKWYNYFLKETRYAEAGIKPDPSGRFWGLSWHDHDIARGTGSEVTETFNYDEGTGEVELFDFKNSITNSLWWYWNAILLRYKPGLASLGWINENTCMNQIKNEYNLFFEDETPNLTNGQFKFPHQYYTGLEKNIVLDGPKIGNSHNPHLYSISENDQRKFTYNTGMVLAALGESYFSLKWKNEGFSALSKDQVIERGIAMSIYGADLFRRTSSPNTIWEYEYEGKGKPLDSKDSNRVFTGILVLGFSEFGEALFDALVNHYDNLNENKGAARLSYAKMSILVKYTASYVHSTFGFVPPAQWIDSDKSGVDDDTKAKALILYISAYRFAKWDEELIKKGLFSASDLLTWPQAVDKDAFCGWKSSTTIDLSECKGTNLKITSAKSKCNNRVTFDGLKLKYEDASLSGVTDQVWYTITASNTGLTSTGTVTVTIGPQVSDVTRVGIIQGPDI